MGALDDIDDMFKHDETKKEHDQKKLGVDTENID